MTQDPISADEQSVDADRKQDDARLAVSYLVAQEADDYIAVMTVLDASPTDLTPDEVAAALRKRGLAMDSSLVGSRLEKLKEWGAVSPRADQTRVRRYEDLLRRNFWYSATTPGRQVQRFYTEVLAQNQVMREIPIQSLNAVVVALEALASPEADWTNQVWLRERINAVFTAHDDLDGALVGAEDTLMGLADRFDLDDERTNELKTLLVGYATRMAVELERGADRGWEALCKLSDRFPALAEITVQASGAADLIERNILAPSRGGNVDDWHGLRAWFDPAHGRSARFQARMVGAIPTFYANLRRLHTAGQSGTSRARALQLATACLDQKYGQQIYLAALGDHSWRKFFSEADDPGPGRTPPWRDGPQVPVAYGLRAYGQPSVRGRAPAPIDDSAAREAVFRRRQERLAQQRAWTTELLAAPTGAVLSYGAARLALGIVMDAVRQTPRQGHRHVVRNGVACNVITANQECAVIRSPSWRVLLPNRMVTFTAADIPTAFSSNGKAHNVSPGVTIEEDTP